MTPCPASRNASPWPALPVLPAAAQGRSLAATLTGSAEVPGPGDPDGSGSARLLTNPGAEEVCWEVTWSNIGTPTAAHIHRGAAGVAGPIVVPLSPIASGCAAGDRGLLRELVGPGEFYVNVHNEEFPAGAIRGQLTK